MVPATGGALSAEQSAEARMLLDRIVAMFMKLGHCGCVLHEQPSEYRAGHNDPDFDTSGCIERRDVASVRLSDAGGAFDMA